MYKRPASGFVQRVTVATNSDWAPLAESIKAAHRCARDVFELTGDVDASTAADALEKLARAAARRAAG